MLFRSPNGVRLLEPLFEKPIISVRLAEQLLGSSFVTADKVVAKIEKLGILKEITGRKRDRLYRFEPYLALFEGTTVASDPTPTKVAARSRGPRTGHG